MDKWAELRTTYQVAKLGTVRAQSSPSLHCASMAAFASSHFCKNNWLFEHKRTCLGLQLDDQTRPISSQIVKVVRKVILRLDFAGIKIFYIIIAII